MSVAINKGYEFSAQPKVIKAVSKYRNDNNLSSKKYTNVMFEPRVVRGNTYSATNFNTEEFDSTTKPRIEKSSIKGKISNIPNENRALESVNEQSESNEKGDRWNVEIQVDDYVETITNKPPCYEQESQTEFKLEKEIIKYTLPKKIGTDIETQIWDGELFDFDYECEPLLSVIVGKTLTQARMEVLEEEELRVMKQEQIRFKKLKIEHEAKMMAMEEKEVKIEEENARKVLEARKAKSKLVETHKLILSRIIAKHIICGVHRFSYDKLIDQGIFRNPLELELDLHFNPFVLKEINERMSFRSEVFSLANQAYDNSLNSILKLHQESVKSKNDLIFKRKEQKRLAIEAQDEAKRQRKLEREMRKEENRREKIREEVKEKFLSKAEIKDSLSEIRIADIDGSGSRKTNFGS